MAVATSTNAMLNQAQLAARLGCTQVRISQYTRNPDWYFGPAPWPENLFPSIERWRQAHRADANATRYADSSGDANVDQETIIARLKQNPEKYARVRLTLERTASLKFQRELAEGKLVDREEVDRQRVRQITAVRSKLVELASRSALIAMKSDKECSTILLEWARESCNYFAGIDPDLE